MSLGQEQTSRAIGVLIGSARSQFGRMEGLEGKLGYIRGNPDVVQTAVDDLDSAIGSLNSFLGEADIPSTHRRLLPNSCTLRQLMQRPGWVRLLPDVAGLLNPNNRIACKATFKAARGLMLMGDRGEAGGWSFHSSIIDPARLVDALAIELYALRVDRDLKVGTPLIVTALEEMLAIHHPCSRMFQSVSGWYTLKEGFSDDLIALVRGLILTPGVGSMVN